MFHLHRICHANHGNLQSRVDFNHIMESLVKLNSWNHTLTESLTLEGTHKGHLVQLPCIEQGHLQLDLGVQSPIQSD